MLHLVIILLLCIVEAIQVFRKTKPYSKNIRNVPTISYRSTVALIAKNSRRLSFLLFCIGIISIGILLQIRYFASVDFKSMKSNNDFLK